LAVTECAKKCFLKYGWQEDARRTPKALRKSAVAASGHHSILGRQRKTWAAIAAQNKGTNSKPVFGLYTNSSNEHRASKSPFGFNDTGLAVNTDRSPEPRTKTGIEADDDPFSVEAILEELFAKTKRRYAGE
jgi:hypothetical protein